MAFLKSLPIFEVTISLRRTLLWSSWSGIPGWLSYHLPRRNPFPLGTKNILFWFSHYYVNILDWLIKWFKKKNLFSITVVFCKRKLEFSIVHLGSTSKANSSTQRQTLDFFQHDAVHITSRIWLNSQNELLPEEDFLSQTKDHSGVLGRYLCLSRARQVLPLPTKLSALWHCHFQQQNTLAFKSQPP